MSTSQPIEPDGSLTPSWMDESKWAFLQENWGLISEVARKWGARFNGHGSMSWAELESGAMMLAVACMRSWDPSKGAFSTYLYRSATRPEKFLRDLNPGYYRKWGMLLSMDVATQELAGDKHDDRHVGKQPATNEECVSEEVARKVMSEELHKAIRKLPPHLQLHARETLEGNVCWRDTKTTIATRRAMLKHLREEMG